MPLYATFVKLYHCFNIFTFSCLQMNPKNHLQQEIQYLKKTTEELQQKNAHLQGQLSQKGKRKQKEKENKTSSNNTGMNTNPDVHQTTIKVNSLDHPESLEFYPTALIADNKVLTYIAGTPVVSSPYLGSRPAFDGSDYIVNYQVSTVISA